MCTVTVVPSGDGFRLVCNRDERRDRRVATPPVARRLAHRTAVFPVDPVGGGTWVAVNNAGLAAVLLNRTIGPPFRTGGPAVRSRGLIIPALIECGSVPDALEVSAHMNPENVGLFRLVLVQRMVAGVVTSDGRTLSIETMDLSRPLVLTSSSLGDHIVEGPRRRLFERLIGAGRGRWLQAQARFHAHQWASRPDLSVRMSRPDARTLSRTQIDVSSRAIELRYDSLDSAEPIVVGAA